MLGLTWDKIDWENKKIYVNLSLYKKELIEPKTHNSIRKINMCSELVKVLEDWKKVCPDSKEKFVFPSPQGGTPDPDNMIHRRFVPLLEKAGIEKLRFHDLRHTYTSILIAKNAQPKLIKNQLGHSSIQVTMDRYGHLMLEVHELGASLLDDFYQEIKTC